MKKASVALYLALSFLFSWSIWIPMAISGVVVESGQGWPTHLLGLLGPAIAAVITTTVTQGWAGLRELFGRVVRVRLHPVWYSILALTASSIALGAVSPHSIDDYLTYSGAGSLGWLVIPYVLVVNGFGEEVGWRGYLAHSLLKRFSQGTTSLMIWLIWGLWHLPLFWVVANFIDLGIGGTIGWVMGLLSGSVFLTWMYERSGKSIFLVAVWHTIFNFSTATTATAGIPAAVSSTLVMVAAAVIMLRPQTWRRKLS